MRFGVSSFAYRYAVASTMASEGTLAAALHVLARSAAAGAEVVQFCDNVPLDTLVADELARVAQEAASSGLAIDVGTRGIALPQLRHYLTLAEDLGSRALRLVLDSDDLSAIEGNLSAILPDLACKEIPLAIENHSDLTGPALASLVERLGGEATYVGICLDTANSLGLLERPLETAAVLAPLALQAHVKDYAVERASIGYRITGRSLGRGWLDLDGLARILGPRLAGLDLYVEQWMDPAEDAPGTLAREEAWVAESLAVLRGWAVETTRRHEDRAYR